MTAFGVAAAPKAYDFKKLTDPAQFTFSKETLKKLGLPQSNTRMPIQDPNALEQGVQESLAKSPAYQVVKKRSDAVQAAIKDMGASRWGKLPKHVLLPKQERRRVLKDTKMNNKQWVQKSKKFSSSRFSHAVGVLGAVDKMSEDTLPGDPPEFFSGVAMHCHKLSHIPLSKSCCALTIKKHGIHINSCSSDAVHLAYARRALRSHKVGSYCSKTVHYIVGKACVEHTQVYCVFSSRLARVIQEKGRAQIHAHPDNNKDVSWGNAHNPHCGGLSAEDLLVLDWTGMHLEQVTGIVPQKKWSTTQKSTLQSGVKRTVAHLKKSHHNAHTITLTQPNAQAHRVLQVTPLEGQGPFIVAATLSAQSSSGAPVDRIRILWGDGSADWVGQEHSAVIEGISVFQIQHRYPVPQKHNTPERIQATFYTETEVFYGRATVMNIWNSANEHYNLGSGAVGAVQRSALLKEVR